MSGARHTEAPEGVSNVMGAVHHWKVYTPKAVHVASCMHAIDALRICFAYGCGATVRYRYGVALWREGDEAACGLEEAARRLEQRFADLGRRASRTNPHGYPDGSPQATGEADAP